MIYMRDLFYFEGEGKQDFEFDFELHVDNKQDWHNVVENVADNDKKVEALEHTFFFFWYTVHP